MPTHQRFARFSCLAVIFAALVLSFSAPASAQLTAQGGISGTVTDPQGAAVPNAKVVIHNVGTNEDTPATTDSSGDYRANGLRPGTYTVSVEVSGFAKFSAENVVVEVGRITNVDIKLQVAGTKAEVVVTGEAPLVNTSQQDFSNNINQKSISELPINGRRWSTFALLTPGVVPDGGFGLLSFRGISGLLNNNTVDGGDNNQAFFSEEKGRTRISYSISEASVQEFQVNTSNYSAEFGRAAGGVVNAVTKSGTNELHGSGFYYNRNNAAGAINPFATQKQLVNGVSTLVHIKPEDNRQQFGGVVGGAIVKDKLFWLFSYDQQERNFPGVASPSDPTALFPITLAAPGSGQTCGTVGSYSGSTAPLPSTSNPALSAGQLLYCRLLVTGGPMTASPTAAQVSAAQTQVNNSLSFLNSLTGIVPRTGDEWILFPKMDWHINNNNLLTVSLNYMHWDSPAGIQTGAVVARGIASFGNDFVRDTSLLAHLYSNIGTSLTNEFRFQYGRDFEFEFAQKPAPGEPLTGPNGFPPDVFISSAIEFGKPTFLQRPKYPDERRYQFADTANITRGRHLFHFGVDINRVNDIDNNLFTEEGSYSFGTLADFITDNSGPYFTSLQGNPYGCLYANTTAKVVFPAQCYSNFAQGFGPPGFNVLTYDYAGFFQDDWKVKPTFTVNLGLRYEYEQLPKPQVPNPALPLTAVFPSDKNNWGPRIGFAWDITGDGKTAFRAGYGIYYGRIINSTIFNAIANTGLIGTGSTPVTQLSSTVFPTSGSAANASAPVYPATLTSAPVGTLNTIQFAPGYQNPLIHQADITFERQIGWDMMLSASYLLSIGRDLPAFIDTNLFAPNASVTYNIVGGPLGGQTFTVPYYSGSARPNTSFGSITSISSVIHSRYDAAVIQASKRFSHGLQFQASYTYSLATDNGQTSQTFTTTNSPFNPFLLGQDQGDSNFDVRNRFVVSGVWSPEPISKDGNIIARGFLNGWTISPIITAQSGMRYSAGVSGNGPSPRQAGGILGLGGSSRLPIVPRNSFTGPRLVDTDMRIGRNIRFKERYNILLFAEAFNLFNHLIPTGVNTTYGSISGTTINAFTISGTTIPSFGTVSSASNTLYQQRLMQFGARFDF